MSNAMFQIGEEFIGDDFPTFIIAEAGCNHECDVDRAKAMVEVAKLSGCDAIKFQTYKAERLVSANAEAYWGDKPIKQIDYYKKLDKFGKDEYKEIFDYAKEVGILAFSTPFDKESAIMLAELGVPLMKIASCDITNLGLIWTVMELGLPTIISTGGASMADITRAVGILSKTVDVAVLACVLQNPATMPYLNRVKLLKELFPTHVVGYSDHTDPDKGVIPMMSVAAGAKIIEKHFTVDKSLSISNHFFAADPRQLSALTFAVRLADSFMGPNSFDRSKEEAEAFSKATRSWHVAKPIKKGEKLTEEHIKFIRPGTGLSYLNLMIGRKVTRDLEVDHMFTLEDLEDDTTT